MAEFLFEIGLEEIPARMIAGAQAELERRVVGMLERERLVVASVAVKSFSTPRRLAVWVGEVAERQENVTEEVLGPSAKIAYKDGVATPAAVAFARKAGVAVEALKTVTTPKGEYLQAISVKAGRGAAEVIAAELPKELAGIYWAKNMYWRAGKPEKFVRPVRWLLALLGRDVVPVEFAGYTSSNVTYGHRVLFGAGAIAVDAPAAYEGALLAASVVADVEARRHTIRKALDRVCRTLPEMRWREDHLLVDKLTHLTEWPTVIAGAFEPEYLTLPEEVLVTVMRDHQSYFAVEDKQDKLAPHFLAVLNTQADAAGEAVIRHGNERVLRARFNDARFFWEFDQRVPLADRVERLSLVTFQTQLGTQASYGEKIKRLEKLTNALVNTTERSDQSLPVIRDVDESSLQKAVQLAKADLTCELVKEFTELQGKIGGLYAKEQGKTIAIWRAIYDHYHPVSTKDSIPSTIEGKILSLADKADTIAGMFAIGLEPTGSKDPLALRRAATGIIKVLIESEVPLDRGLNFIAQQALATYGSEIIRWVSGVGDSLPRRTETPIDHSFVVQRIISFLVERLEFYLLEVRGQAYDTVKAVLAEGYDDVRDAVKRAEDVTTVRGLADFAAVCALFKRMKNIITQAKEKSLSVGAYVDTVLLRDPAELTLAERAGDLAVRFSMLKMQKNYIAALEAIATLRPQVDAFFEAVMVMVPDEAVRANRLALLAKVLQDFSGIADFSEIVTQG